jgi:hypothetical protein
MIPVETVVAEKTHTGKAGFPPNVPQALID